MTTITLLPARTQRRTGKLYDNPDHQVPGGQTVVGGKTVIITDDGVKLLRDKTWTAEGGWCVVVTSASNHALIARAIDHLEDDADERVLEELRYLGYAL